MEKFGTIFENCEADLENVCWKIYVLITLLITAASACCFASRVKGIKLLQNFEYHLVFRNIQRGYSAQIVRSFAV